MPSVQLQRAMAAVKAMKLIGFGQGVAKTALKKLLKVYENKWEYIEAENYRLLVDSILDTEESKDPEANEKDSTFSNEVETRKRLRHKQEESGHSMLTTEPEAFGETLLKRKKLEPSAEISLINSRGETMEHVEAQCSYKEKDGSQPEKGSLVSHSSHHKDEQNMCGRAGNALYFKEPKTEQDSEALQVITLNDSSIIPDKPMNETCIDTSGNLDDPINVLAPSEITSPNSEKGDMSKLATAQEMFSTDVNIASSNTGKVKLSLTCRSDYQNLKMPSIESVFKIVEDRCLKSYKTLQPNFSLMNLMKEVCQSAADLIAESSNSQESLKGSRSPGIHCRLTRTSFIGSSNLVTSETPRESMNGLDSSQHIDGDSNYIQENCAPEFSDNNASHSLTNFPLHENAVIASSPLLDENDISKGEERIKISFINEFTSEKAPPYFHYIPWNAIYQNAHVKFSLAQIGEEDCCLNCFGNCLNSSIPCSCTRETGGEFVYTLNGLLKKEFLDECFSMSRFPGKHRFHCKGCPIEKSKTQATDAPDPCKGHLVRKFIKECWSKCGCNKQCGNRVVQRGITHNLQVFYTNGGKGWGLRTLEELPKGAFVCEFVGEILTNRELYDRTLERTGHANLTYPVLLDADWGSEEELKDEKALCLDATFYGNVGRFVNHRCSDANLVEIPVEWETPDHHYYHLAYFTSRKIEAMEELTRDYGIDFKNPTHPIKAFKCLCGSRYCRGSFRSKTRSRASASK